MEIRIVSILLVTEKIPLDLTAIGLMAALSLTGVLTPEETVAGLAHPAVVTVGAMFLVSRGLVRTGAVEFIGGRVIHYSGGSAGMALFIINAAAVLLFPIAVSVARELDVDPRPFIIGVCIGACFAPPSAARQISWCTPPAVTDPPITSSWASP
ncbi:MAG: hypothetical protein GY859_27350 [Desulfobacterales bacterium]|nr:hypothetical protein [Desulfobacterales bacterium]